MVRVHEGPPFANKSRTSRANPHTAPPSQNTQKGVKQGALSLLEAFEAFLLNKQVGGCTTRTVQLYRETLTPLIRAIPDPTPLSVQRYLAALRERVNSTTVHMHFSKLRAFFRWCVEVGILGDNPLRGMTMRTPRILPKAATDDDLLRLLKVCGDTWHGRRNAALVCVLADSGLRVSEAIRVRVEHVNFLTKTIMVRQGKMQQDGIAHFGSETARRLKQWLAKRPAHMEELLFADDEGRGLTRNHALHILHRLSIKARLSQKVSPHKLRAFAATSLLKNGADIETVRRAMRHANISTTMGYVRLAGIDVARRFQVASPLDNLGR